MSKRNTSATRWSPRICLKEKVNKYQDSDDEDLSLTPYRKKLNKLFKLGGPKLVQEYKTNEARRSQLRRINMSPEQKQRVNEKARIRNRRYREKLRAEGKIKRRTRKERNKIREYNKLKKRESRSRMSDKERKRIRLELAKQESDVEDEEEDEENNEPVNTSGCSSSSSSEESEDEEIQAALEEVGNILNRLTPEQKVKLADKGVCSPKTAQKRTISNSVVDNMMEECESLKHKRSKTCLYRRRNLLQYLSGTSQVKENVTEQNTEEGEDILDAVSTDGSQVSPVEDNSTGIVAIDSSADVALINHYSKAAQKENVSWEKVEVKENVVDQNKEEGKDIVDNMLHLVSEIDSSQVKENVAEQNTEEGKDMRDVVSTDGSQVSPVEDNSTEKVAIDSSADVAQINHHSKTAQKENVSGEKVEVKENVVDQNKEEGKDIVDSMLHLVSEIDSSQVKENSAEQNTEEGKDMWDVVSTDGSQLCPVGENSTERLAVNSSADLSEMNHSNTAQKENVSGVKLQVKERVVDQNTEEGKDIVDSMLHVVSAEDSSQAQENMAEQNTEEGKNMLDGASTDSSQVNPVEENSTGKVVLDSSADVEEMSNHSNTAQAENVSGENVQVTEYTIDQNTEESKEIVDNMLHIVLVDDSLQAQEKMAEQNTEEGEDLLDVVSADGSQVSQVEDEVKDMFDGASTGGSQVSPVEENSTEEVAIDSSADVAKINHHSNTVQEGNVSGEKVATRNYVRRSKKMQIFNIHWRQTKAKAKPYEEKPHGRAISEETEKRIEKFLEDPQNCVTDPNKRYVMKKSRKARTILNKTMKRHHRDFLKKERCQIGFSTFCKKRPKHTIPRKFNKWVQCLCLKCENMELKMNAIKHHVPISNISSFMKYILCPRKGQYYEKACIEGSCKECGIDPLLECLETELPEYVRWKQWENVTEKEKKRNVTRKWRVTKETSKKIFLQEIKDSYRQIVKHVHDIYWQQQQISNKRASLKDGEVMLGMDFSEKWRTDWQFEVSAAHYGYKLVSVFPIVAHYMCQTPGCCSIVKEAIIIASDDAKNDCDAVSAYVEEAIKHLQENSQVDIQKEIWVTDQCRSQFKGSRAFFRLSEMPLPIHHVFFAPGHGKSLSDGEGAVVKKHVSNLVQAGELEIENAADFAGACQSISTCQKTAADIHQLHTENHPIRTVLVVNTRNKTDVPELKTAKGTSLFFSVSNVPGEIGIIRSRNSTCFCTYCELGSFEQCEHKAYTGPCVTHSLIKPSAKSHRNYKIKKTCTKSGTSVKSGTKSREMYYISLQKRFQEWTFDEIKSKGEELVNVYDLPDVPQCDTVEKLHVDESACTLYPDDAPQEMLPCRITGDGNCLPRCGSLFVFGSQNHATEIRIRTLVELAAHEEYYTRDKDVVQRFMQYMEGFIPDKKQNLSELYRLEVMATLKNGSYNGMWGVLGLSSALQIPVLSVYPKYGGFTVRKDLNTLVMPRINAGQAQMAIMWTNTRGKTIPEQSWLPNHFCLLRPREFFSTEDLRNKPKKGKEDQDFHLVVTQTKINGGEGPGSDHSNDNTAYNMSRPSALEVGQYILVSFGLEMYPAVVVKKDEKSSWVKYYMPVKGTGRLWTDGDIEYRILLEDVVRILQPPTYVPHRRIIQYQFPDL